MNILSTESQSRKELVGRIARPALLYRSGWNRKSKETKEWVSESSWKIIKDQRKYKSHPAPLNGAHVPFFWPNHHFLPTISWISLRPFSPFFFLLFSREKKEKKHLFRFVFFFIILKSFCLPQTLGFEDSPRKRRTLEAFGFLHLFLPVPTSELSP